MSQWKDTEIGLIPKEWNLSPLENHIVQERGITYGIVKVGEFIPEGVPVIRGGDIKEGKIVFDDSKRVTEEVSNQFKRTIIKGGEIVLNLIAEPGHAAIVPDSLIGCNVSRDVAVIPLDESVDHKFICYFLRSKLGIEWLTQRLQGTVTKKINLGVLKKFPIPIFEVKKQKIIADILSCLDAKIENLRRQNETLERIAQTLFKHWFIDFEFPNEKGEPYRSSGGAMQPSELGEIPAGWRVGKLGDVVDVNAKSINKDYKYKNIEYVDISSVGIGKLESTNLYALKDAPSRARRLVSHGDVIWSGVRPNRKSYLYISHPAQNLVVSTGFITLTPSLIPASYLYSWVTTDTFVEYLTFNASGSAYPAVKAEHFEIAEILLPDKSTLSNFHSVIDTVREKIYFNSKQIQALTKTRDTLLPKLMSGKLRVPSPSPSHRGGGSDGG